MSIIQIRKNLWLVFDACGRYLASFTHQPSFTEMAALRA